MSFEKDSTPLPRWKQPNKRPHRHILSPVTITVALFTCLGLRYLFYSSPAQRNLVTEKYRYAKFQQCSIDNLLSTGLPALDSAAPLPVEEFVERRNRLAVALVEDGLEAFVVEPGYTFSYYANVSQEIWEVWEPEERPFLMVVLPHINSTTSEITAHTVFLAPSFEAPRARLLGMPFLEPIDIIRWEEHWDPYETLLKHWPSPRSFDSSQPKIMVDEEMRDFISRGLNSSGFAVQGLGGAVERVKQTKSLREIEILRAVNTLTVVAVREMRKCLYEGLSENQIMNVLDNTLRAAGLEPFFDIVLFDENASNPHGGTDGSKTLQAETFVLIDVGAHLYGYSSDICRTFFPPFYPQPSDLSTLPLHIQHKLNIWDLVLSAQTASMHQMSSSPALNSTAASVDIAARTIISDAGYGEAFTHRVGHGIGIKAHESPYLNKGNTGTKLRAGMVFTSEPGVYLEGEFGVRHEDVLLVGDGEPAVLSGIRATGPWNP